MNLCERYQLSPRQFKVLQLFLHGYPGKESAFLMGLSQKTIAFHKARLMEKLKTPNDVELVKFGIREGLITTEAPWI